MKDVKKLLEHRKALKAKKPSFIREGFSKRKKLGLKWRRPKGVHSKMRHDFRGHRKSVRKGYRSPVLVRGLDRSGLKVVYVSNIKELERVDKREGIVIKKAVGLRKTIELLKKAKELSLVVLNVRDVQAFLVKAEEQLKNKKEIKKQKLEEKKKKEKKEEKKKEGKKGKKKETTDELAERVKREEEEQKKEKDKILTKRI